PVPVCTAGERQADTTDCHKFTECKDGAWKEDSCFWFRKFDSVTKKCVMWGATCAQ
ncbi:chitin-binding domain-containing protein, partial [Isoptericola croceus]|uniref:chitin-binding domain-containing protein n=1 Tax=Isoptericola croceus TaxID=3031406 RepID=UPI0034D49CAB